MNDLDRLILDQFVPFRERVLAAVREKHPYLLSMINAFLANKENRVGMQVTENGQVVGEYTFHLAGIQVVKTESGKLESEVHHPFLGVVKPYVLVERAALERMIADEAAFSADVFAALPKYLPELTIKFFG
ncbi:MAG TPA: hypothetical protein PKA10_16030 [Selenomonadales bacterium]|nr:hypothetical protein [Selenomonadales bacterium]